MLVVRDVRTVIEVFLHLQSMNIWFYFGSILLCSLEIFFLGHKCHFGAFVERTNARCCLAIKRNYSLELPAPVSFFYAALFIGQSQINTSYRDVLLPVDLKCISKHAFICLIKALVNVLLTICYSKWRRLV